MTDPIIAPPTLRLVAPDGRSWPVPEPWTVYVDIGILGMGDGDVAHLRVDLSETPRPDGPIEHAITQWTYTDARYDGTPPGVHNGPSGTAVIDPDGSVRLHLDAIPGGQTG